MKNDRVSPASRRYLITGGAGFLGGNFAGFLLQEDPEAVVRVLDRLSYSGTRASLREFESDPRFEFVHGDICDSATVAQALQGVNRVVNFAAEVSVDRSIINSHSCVRTGIIGVHTLLEQARCVGGVEKFLQVSTDEVYGTVTDESCSENSPVRPRNPYAAVKLAGETLAISYHETFGLPVIVTRATNTYGPKAHPEKVIPLFITNLIDRKKIPVFGDGGQVRDWLFAEDHCRAIYTVLCMGQNGQIYNVGAGQECTNLELTRRILDIMGLDEDMIKFVKDRPGHDRRYSLNCEKIAGLGWKPRYRLSEGLARTISWYRQNEPWWRPLKNSMNTPHQDGFWGDAA